MDQKERRQNRMDLASSHLKKEKHTGTHGIYASLCNVDSFRIFLNDIKEPVESPVIQVNHFVACEKPSPYCVFYDAPVWISELVPFSYDLLEVASPTTELPKDPRVKSGTYALKDPGSLTWAFVTGQWYSAGSLFRLRKSSTPKAVVVHKKTQTPCTIDDFTRGIPSWTWCQLDIFVPKCRGEENREPVPLPEAVLCALLGQSQDLQDHSDSKSLEDTEETPKLFPSKYQFALSVSQETLLKWI